MCSPLRLRARAVVSASANSTNAVPVCRHHHQPTTAITPSSTTRTCRPSRSSINGGVPPSAHPEKNFQVVHTRVKQALRSRHAHFNNVSNRGAPRQSAHSQHLTYSSALQTDNVVMSHEIVVMRSCARWRSLTLVRVLMLLWLHAAFSASNTTMCRRT
jgi:hypothetical protein